MECHYMVKPFRDGDFSSQRMGGHGRYEAAQHIRVLALAGNLDITAEVIDDEGEVVCSYQNGVWRDG
jgi:hypothetical protein